MTTAQKYDPTKHHAIAYDEDGFVVEKDALEDHFDEGWQLSELLIVTGTAVPVPQSSRADEEFYRGPASYQTDDVISETDWADEIEDAEQALAQLERFEKMAKALDA